MRTLYAVQFEVASPDGRSADDAAKRVRQLATEWVSEWYARNQQPPPDVPVDGGDWRSEPGHLLRVRSLRPRGGAELWTLTWSHPSDSDETLMWTSECLVATADGDTEVSIAVRLESTHFKLAPLEFDVGRPRLVRRLIEDLPCRVNGCTLRTGPTSVAVEDVARLVEQELLSPARALPAIIFSRDSWSQVYLADPTATADAVVGLAQVYALQDKWAAFALTNELGRSLSCFNGAARLYWPGLTRTADPYKHPLFLPERIRAMEEDGRSVRDALFRRLAAISAVRFIHGTVTGKVLAAVEQEDAKRRDEVRSGLIDRASLEEEILGALDARDRVRAELHQEQQRSLELELRLVELEEENRDLKASFAQVGRYVPDRSQEKARPVQPADLDVRSVREALNRAACDFPDRLDVWRTAEDSADKSSFSRPAQVYQALLAIKEVAEAYFRSRQSGKAMGPWEKAFAERGFKYAAAESQNTLNMYGDERVFVHKGRRLQMQKHLTLGGGDRQNCLQIYFETEESPQRFVIGYCGMHLRYYGMTT